MTTPQSSTPWRVLLLTLALMALAACGSSPQVTPTPDGGTTTHGTGGSGGTGGTTAGTGGTGNGGADAGSGGGQGGGGAATCTVDADCGGATPKCAPATHHCVACTASSDCGSPSLACAPATGTCELACATSNDCPEGQPVCDPLAGVCVAASCSTEFGCFAWQEGAWTACGGGTCSGGGTQTRAVTCLDSAGEVASDSACSQPKPDTAQACTDLTACFYHWAGTWGACSTTCGVGTQARTLTCQRSDGATVPDSFCTDPKPDTSQTCSDDSGCPYQWVGTWGACSTTCGAGTQTRAVTCQRASDGATVADSFCSALPKPAGTQACTDTSACTYAWLPSAWSACGTTCGAGTQTRTLTCQRSDGAMVADSFCATATKPATTQPCTDTSLCTYQWVGTWGACSSTCGAGTQTRALVCQRADGTAVADALCPQPKPDTTQACNGTSSCAYQWVGPWGACSAACGTGTQTRTLTCQRVSDGATVPDSDCQAVPAPPTSQVCTAYAGCTYSWVAGGFGACSGACGAGTQTQTVACRRSDGAPVADASCDPASKPPTSQPCSAGPCPPPTCTLSIAPSSGGASTTFTASWASSSNGATFQYSYDGAAYQPAPPTGWLQFLGSGYPVGAHTFNVQVTNADGTGTCSTGFTISPAPTCNVSVTPVSGTAGTTFTAGWTSSNATLCTWSLNGVDQGSAPCDGSASFPGSQFGDGTYAIAVSAAGPGGVGTCSTSFSVGTTSAPVCSISVSPTTGGYTTASGGTNTSFTASWTSSNATSCSWSLNGVSQGAVPCDGSAAFTGSQLGGKGTYSIVLTIAGPGGNNACSTSVSLVDAPTCTLNVTPTSGLTTTTFTANWSTSSDATSAAFYVDTASIGSGSCASGFCTGSTMVLGSLVGPGAHTVYLRPTGPGGTGSCSVSIYVGTPNPPTCSISVTPTSGYTSTTYAANWSSSSDATSCTWSLDGVSQGAIACAGGTSFTGAAVGAGNHTVSLQPTGPGGTGSCTASFQTTGAPTCSVQASSASVSWSSANAISCTFIGSAIPCSGTQPGPIPSGTYCLDATNPSGTTQCCGTVP